jgi:ABC-type molybdate transport system substrate-binding protein
VSARCRARARNVLTVVEPAVPRVDLVEPGDLLDARVTRIAVGNPRTVPAGQYPEEVDDGFVYATGAASRRAADPSAARERLGFQPAPAGAR